MNIKRIKKIIKISAAFVGFSTFSLLREAVRAFVYFLEKFK